MTTNIFAIAIQLGWTTTPRYKDGELYIDFHRKTLSGVPFSFTAKMGEGKIGNLVKEIESFVDAIDPEICAEEWMIKSGSRCAFPFATSGKRYGCHPYRCLAVGLYACRSGRTIRFGRSA